MDDQTTKALLKRLTKLEGESVRLRVGELTDDAPLSIALGGAGTPYADVAALVGTNVEGVSGGRVAALVSGASLLVLGGVAPGVGIPLVTALPATPIDGQEVYFQSTAMATAGVVWRLRYNAGSASAYKWEFAGGSELINRSATTTGGITSGAYSTTGQPALTVPLAGDYLVQFGGFVQMEIINGLAEELRLGLFVSGSISGNPGRLVIPVSAQWGGIDELRTRREMTLAAGVTLNVRHGCTANGAVQYRAGLKYVGVQPVRVG